MEAFGTARGNLILDRHVQQVRYGIQIEELPIALFFFHIYYYIHFFSFSFSLFSSFYFIILSYFIFSTVVLFIAYVIIDLIF